MASVFWNFVNGMEACVYSHHIRSLYSHQLILSFNAQFEDRASSSYLFIYFIDDNDDAMDRLKQG